MLGDKDVMINYIIITAAKCAPENRQKALSYMPEFANKLVQNAGALRCRFGVTMSGIVPGALVFVQMYESLSGYEKAIDVMPKSKAYLGMINDAGANVYVRNVMKAMPLEFIEGSEEAKYLVLTRAMPQTGMSPEEFTGEVQNAAATFSDGGALTMRLGRIITGTNPGGYMLGVSYPSLDAVEATYDRLGSSTSFSNFANKIDINMRSIVRLHG